MGDDGMPKGLDWFGQLLGGVQNPPAFGGSQAAPSLGQIVGGLQLAGQAAQSQPSQQQMDLLAQMLGQPGSLSAPSVADVIARRRAPEPAAPAPARAPVETDIGAVAANRKITK